MKPCKDTLEVVDELLFSLSIRAATTRLDKVRFLEYTTAEIRIALADWLINGVSPNFSNIETRVIDWIENEQEKMETD
jgi:hypothetical protein